MDEEEEEEEEFSSRRPAKRNRRVVDVSDDGETSDDDDDNGEAEAAAKAEAEAAAEAAEAEAAAAEEKEAEQAAKAKAKAAKAAAVAAAAPAAADVGPPKNIRKRTRTFVNSQGMVGASRSPLHSPPLDQPPAPNPIGLVKLPPRPMQITAERATGLVCVVCVCVRAAGRPRVLLSLLQLNGVSSAGQTPRKSMRRWRPMAPSL